MPVDFAPGSRRTLSFLGISNASCQLHHLAILFRTIADLGRAMTYWGITLNFVKCLWPAKVWPKYLICKWRKTTSNMVIYFIRDYFLTASETGLKEVWSCKRFGKKKAMFPSSTSTGSLGRRFGDYTETDSWIKQWAVETRLLTFEVLDTPSFWYW